MTFQHTFSWGYVAVCIWKEPPCRGRLFGCYHVEGEPGLEDYECVIPLTRKWSLLLCYSKPYPAPHPKED